MNITLRYPELGKELKFAISSENYLEELNYQLLSLFGVGSDSFILLNDQGLSLKDKNIPKKNSEFIYAFLKDSIKKEKPELNIDFLIQKSDKESGLPGEDRGPLLIEKALYKLYIKSSDYQDFLNSYLSFSAQLESEMAIINSASKVLEFYHNKHIQDQIESFASLYKKNLAHYQNAQNELFDFGNSVKQLETHKIHEKLRSDKRETLSELIDLVQLTKWKETYVSEIERLQTKFEDLEKIIKEVPNKFQLPKSLQNLFKARSLSDDILAAASYPVELYLEYRKLCELYLNNGNAGAGARLHEEKWEQKLSQAHTYMSTVEGYLPSLKQSIEEMKIQRKAANLQLFGLLRKITEFAAKIRDTVKSQLSMLSSLLKRSEKRLSFIKVPKLLPEAHESTITEISRRNWFVRVATELKEKLNSLIENEISERMKFLEKYKHVLPNNFIPQLSAAPFIKIVALQDEPDLTLPQISESSADCILYPNDYTLSKNDLFNNKLQEDMIELNQKYLQRQEIIKTLETEKNELENKYNLLINEVFPEKERKIKDFELDIKGYKKEVENLNRELNHARKFQDMYFQEKMALTNNESKLASRNQELQLLVDALKATITEQNQLLTANDELSKKSQENYENLITSIQEKDINYKREKEKSNEIIKKLGQDLQAKDQLIIQTLGQLDEFAEEFKGKEKKLQEIKSELNIEKAKNLELQIQKNIAGPSIEIEELCKGLSIEPSANGILSYIAQLKESNSSKISFTQFNENSLALFFPTAEGQFLAFNYNCPDHYLNLDSLNGQSLEIISSLPYIVGLITEKKTVIAEKNNSLFLPQGKEFFLLSIKEQPI